MATGVKNAKEFDFHESDYWMVRLNPKGGPLLLRIEGVKEGEEMELVKDTLAHWIPNTIHIKIDGGVVVSTAEYEEADPNTVKLENGLKTDFPTIQKPKMLKVFRR